MHSLLLVLTVAAASPSVSWETVRDEDGIRVLRHDDPEDEIVAFKAETVLAAPLERVASVLVDVPNRQEWMPMLLESRIVRRTSEAERIEYMALKTPPLVTNRDFVFRGRASYDAGRGELRLDFFPGDDAEVPVSPDFVRGKILGGGYVLRRVDGDRTYAEYSVRVDPCGAIPKWIVNALAHNAPFNTLANLRERLTKQVLLLTEVSSLLGSPSLSQPTSSGSSPSADSRQGRTDPSASRPRQNTPASR